LRNNSNELSFPKDSERDILSSFSMKNKIKQPLIIITFESSTENSG